MMSEQLPKLQHRFLDQFGPGQEQSSVKKSRKLVKTLQERWHAGD